MRSELNRQAGELVEFFITRTQRISTMQRFERRMSAGGAGELAESKFASALARADGTVRTMAALANKAVILFDLRRARGIET